MTEVLARLTDDAYIHIYTEKRIHLSKKEKKNGLLSPMKKIYYLNKFKVLRNITNTNSQILLQPVFTSMTIKQMSSQRDKPHHIQEDRLDPCNDSLFRVWRNKVINTECK